MKKKSLDRCKHGNSTRREVRSAHAKPRQIRKNKKDPSESIAWLRILPLGIEDDPPTDFARGLFSLRNGRRQPRDLDLYIPEENQRSR
jgi:hypothetical protein